MTSRIFLDSSLLVEYIKGTETHLLDAFRQSQTVMLYLSQTVVSEYLFYHLAELGQKAPRTLKENTKIAGILAGTDPIPFLELFTWLPDDAALLRPAVRLMATYNLLPNDALILAICRHHGIPALASFDPDFAVPCEAEGIALLRSVADFEAFQQEK